MRAGRRITRARLVHRRTILREKPPHAGAAATKPRTKRRKTAGTSASRLSGEASQIEESSSLRATCVAPERLLGDLQLFGLVARRGGRLRRRRGRLPWRGLLGLRRGAL